jgi:hypothetical protein
MKIADLYEAADNAKESERNNHILFRDTVHPTAGYPIIIIESFFIDEE